MSEDLGIQCEFRTKAGGGRFRQRLWATYEINGTSLSDDYTPEDISAEDLLYRWANWAEAAHPTGIVPILWTLSGESIFEYLPGLISGWGPLKHEDFLTYFTPPIRTDSEERLRWIDLPVRDLHWDLHDGGDKGGFVQEATGWKPSIFQPFVLLDHLIGFVDTKHVRGAGDVWEFQQRQREAS